jgi:hypothetical protein
MWHAARRGARLAASNASTASAARALRGEAASRATGVASSWPAGASDASALARRLDWPSPSGFASAAHAAVAARGASGPRAPPLALRAARALLHASPASAGDERDKKYTGRPDGKDGKDHKTRKRDGEKGEKGERGSSALSASRYRDANVGSDAADDDRVLSELLAGAKAVAVREHLEALSSPDAADREPGTKPTTHLTRAAFDALLAEHGYADAASRADATRAFRDAGAVVVLGDLVYLDGAQVTRDILHALPAVPGAVYGLDPKTLAELESEMAAIQVDVDAAAARAARRSNAIVFGGLVLLCAQLGDVRAPDVRRAELGRDGAHLVFRGRLQRHPAVRVLHGQPAGLLLRRLVEAHARALPAPEHRARARRRRSVRGARQEAREKKWRVTRRGSIGERVRIFMPRRPNRPKGCVR